MEDEDKLVLNIPDSKSIPCLTCKWGRMNYMAMYCAKYNIKPRKVYYENAECDKYEKL